MRNKGTWKRVIAVLLAICMLSGPVTALAARDHLVDLEWEETEYNKDLRAAGGVVEEKGEEPAPYDNDDVVRVSIVLDKESTMEAGYDIASISADAAAESYREKLEDEQLTVTQRIEREALNGQELDVVWNLTLVVNVISANVRYGDIEAIKAVSGVADVFVENTYSPEVIDDDLEVDPNMATSSSQIGSAAAWAVGYTGAGQRVAIIDTGIKHTHKSFDEGAFLYALQELGQEAVEAGEAASADAYIASLNLLNAAEIEEHKMELNAFRRGGGVTSERLHLSAKIPFAYNYADQNFDTTHDNDGQSEHGSHVAGIAAANRYVNANFGQEGVQPEYVDALTEVLVQGVAPDAQIVVMKVFGSTSAGSDSDIFAALEDAIVLGCDSVNMSLGSADAGYAYAGYYQSVMDRLVEEDIVFVASAGNYYSWAEYSRNVSTQGGINGFLHSDDVNFLTGGFPGTYTNALTIASVNNNGRTGAYVKALGSGDIPDKLMVYWESNATYGVNVMAQLHNGGEPYEYVYMDNYGTEEDFDALGEEILTGKIVICNRGGNQNLMDKAIRAAERGAVAVIIVNNQDGTYNLGMSDYEYTKVPVVGVNQNNRQALLDRAEKRTAEGGAEYYLGKMVVGNGVYSDYASEFFGDTESTMSYFSSWGIPGTLELKPEVAAPGGNIYSVDGKKSSNNIGYENMSGTSMAAPQVTGMVALLSQYIKENGIVEKTGMTQRHLISSLLMSTAVPMKENLGDAVNSAGQDKAWYSVMWQGAGLANVYNAISASSYITMGSDATRSYADGKVKAELGAKEDGMYSFSFTVHNFSEEDAGYNLSTELFTQDIFERYDGTPLLDQTTAPLMASVTYTANGRTVELLSRIDADVNRDGVTNDEDARCILEYVLDNTVEIDTDAADVDGDGSITTYDAHMILAAIETEVVTAPAGGEVEISVTIQILSDVSAYPNGAYVEGYTFVEPILDDESKRTDAEHSIPILGFYGNWSDPSMFERNSLVNSLYGDTTLPYFTGASTLSMDGQTYTVYNANSMTYYDRIEKEEYTFIGNPFGVEKDNNGTPVFPEGRGAIRSDEEIRSITYSMIRNAAVTALIIRDAKSGKVLKVLSPISYSSYNLAAAYYNGGWHGAYVIDNPRKSPAELGLQEDDMVDVSILAIPEYYISEDMLDEDGNVSDEQIISLVESNVLGDGAYLTTTLNVDDTRPSLIGIQQNEDRGDIIVTVSDNQYIAYLGLMTRSGVQTVQEVLGPKPDEGEATRGGELTYTFHLTEEQKNKIGTQFMLVIGDYAGNQYSVRSEYKGGTDPDLEGKFFAFASAPRDIQEAYPRWTDATWFTIDPNTVNVTWDAAHMEGVEPYSYCLEGAVTAAEYVDGYVFYTVGSMLYASSIYEIESSVVVSDLANYGLTRVSDISYNFADGKLYAMNNTCTGNGTKNINPLWRIDPLSGAAEQVAAVDIEDPEGNFSMVGRRNIVSFAIDNGGNFYGATRYQSNEDNNCSRLVKWRVDDLPETDGIPTVKSQFIGCIREGGTSVQENDGMGSSGGTMTWDHDANKLYLVNFCGTNTSLLQQDYLWEINPSTGAATSMGPLQMNTQGLFIVPNKDTKWDVSFAPTDEIASIVFDKKDLNLYVTGTESIGYYLTPWTLMEGSYQLGWSSSAEDIVEVDEYGNITALAAGDATITATAGDVSAQCHVTVQEIPSIQLSAIVYDTDAKAYWSTFDAAKPQEWKKVEEDTYEFMGGTLASDGMLYMQDTRFLFAVDPDTLTGDSILALPAGYIYSDAAPVYTINDIGYDFVGLNSAGEAMTVFRAYIGDADFYALNGRIPIDTDRDRAAVIAYRETKQHNNYDPMHSIHSDCMTDFYYMISERGELYEIFIFPDVSGTASEMYGVDLGRIEGVELTDVARQGQSARATLFYDNDTGLLVLISYIEAAGDNAAKVQYIDVSDTDNLRVVATTRFPENVWPVVSAYQHERQTELTIKARQTEFNIKAGLTVQLEAKVIWDTNNEGVTWTSQNPGVATVDQTGLVTGVDTGTATIVAETKAARADGSHAKMEYTVYVQGRDKLDTDVTVRAQVKFNDGTAAWVSIPLNNPANYTEITSKTPVTDSAPFLTGGGLGAGGYIYGSDIDLYGSLQEEGYYYKLDPRDDKYSVEASTTWGWQESPIDMAHSPKDYGFILTYDTGNDLEIYHRGTFVMASANAMKTPSSDYGVPEMDVNYDAIAYHSTLSSGKDRFWGLAGDRVYYIDIGATIIDGAVDTEDLSFSTSKMVSYYSYYPLSVKFSSEDNLSMVRVAGVDADYPTYAGMVVSCAGADSVDIYYFDYWSYTEDWSHMKVYYLGSIPGAVDISCLHTEDELKTALAARTASVDEAAEETFVVAQEPEIVGAEKPEIANIVTGSTNAISVDRPVAGRTGSDASGIDTNANTVTVRVSAADSSNGLVQVAYDPALLTPVTVTARIPFLTYAIDEENGTVTLAFAAPTPITAYVAELQFSYPEAKELGMKTSLTVTPLQDGKTLTPGASDTIPVEIPLPTFTPSTPSTPSTPANPDVTTGDAPENGKIITETTATPGASVENGEASSSVSDAMGDEIVRQAEANQSDLVVVAPKMPDDVTKAEVSIPGETVAGIAEKTDAELRVETPVANVTIPNEALAELGKGDTVTVTAEKSGDTITVQVAVDGAAVDSIPSGLKAALPLKDGEVAVQVNADGSETLIPKSLVEDGRTYVLLDGCATVKIIDNSKTFTDVADDAWFASAVKFASSHELYNGTGGGQFSPDEPMDRGMLATVLWRLESRETAGGKAEFTDVADDAWYAEGVAWANIHGIVKGYGDGIFAPEDSITREELAVMLYRYAGYAGLDTTATDTLERFTDAGQVSGWADAAVKWAVANGLLQGKGAGILDPAGSASRAEVAMILQRLVRLMVK